MKFSMKFSSIFILSCVENNGYVRRLNKIDLLREM